MHCTRNSCSNGVKINRSISHSRSASKAKVERDSWTSPLPHRRRWKLILPLKKNDQFRVFDNLLHRVPTNCAVVATRKTFSVGHVHRYVSTYLTKHICRHVNINSLLREPSSKKQYYLQKSLLKYLLPK